MSNLRFERNAKIIQLIEDAGLSRVEVAVQMGLSRNVIDGVMWRWNAKQANESQANKVHIQGQGNEQVVTGPRNGIVLRTLDDLIKFAKIDLAKWIIAKWVANFWGSANNPNTQVKAWLVKEEPLALKPVISPVQIKIGRIPATLEEKTSGRKRALVLFDAQIGFMKSLKTGILTPFHDRLAIDIALQIAQKLKPDMIIFGGDWLDLADWTDKFARSPNMYWTTQPAVLELAWWLGQFRKTTAGELHKIEGNHEARLPKKIIEHMKEAYGLRSVDNMELPPTLSIPRLLALHDLGIEWHGDYPNGQVWINDCLKAEHGAKVKSHSGGTVTEIIKHAQESSIVGHTHRIEMAHKTLYSRGGARSVVVLSPGCLCRVDGIVPGVKKQQNWQQGIGVADYFDDGRHYPQAVPIVNGKAYFEGKEYTGRDRVEELRQATGWEF